MMTITITVPAKGGVTLRIEIKPGASPATAREMIGRAVKTLLRHRSALSLMPDQANVKMIGQQPRKAAWWRRPEP